MAVCSRAVAAGADPLWLTSISLSDHAVHHHLHWALAQARVADGDLHHDRGPPAGWLGASGLLSTVRSGRRENRRRSTGS